MIGTVAPGRVRYTWDVVTHLVGREFKLRYARAFVGWLWAIADPLARLLILSFLFKRILVVEQDNYTVFLFVGIITWSWFAGALTSATASAVDRRDLLFRPGIPRPAVPVVSVLTDFLDLLAALPVLVIFLVLEGTVPWTGIAFPGVLFVEFLLILGLGYMLCAANVWVRDVRHLVVTAMALGFYLTPVFYGRSNVPERFQWVQTVNPMTHILEAHRAVLINGDLPDRGFYLVSAFAVVVFCVGYVIYRHLSATFVDEL